MAGHIAKGSSPEIPPATPVPRMVNLVVGTVGCRSYEKIPVQFGMRCMDLGGRFQALGPDWPVREGFYPCLLYTSDAADDLLCVDLGGRRIIKKKTHKITLLHHTSTTNYNGTTTAAQ